MAKILLISNGYGENSFSNLLLESLVQELEKEQLPLKVEILSVVGEGKAFDRWLSHPQVSMFHSSPSLPYGGVYLGRIKERVRHFIKDFQIQKKNLRVIQKKLISMIDEIDWVIGVGDFLPVLISKLFLKKKVFLVACYHSYLLKRSNKPYEKIGIYTAHLFRHYASRVYTRDYPTAKWFKSLGINAHYLGFLGPSPSILVPQRREIILLTGSREDWKENLQFLAKTLQYTSPSLLQSFSIHWVFPPEREEEEIKEEMKKVKTNFAFSRGDYLEHLSRGALVVGFAGTAIQQAASLGIPSLRTYREGAIQIINKRQKPLLGDALITGADTPQETAKILEEVLTHLSFYQKRAQEFSEKTWGRKKEGAKNIARDLVKELQKSFSNNFHKVLPLSPDITPVEAGYHSDRQ